MRESFRPSLHKQEQNSEEDLRLRAEQLLEKVDFHLLRDIFSEERRKSGLDAENTNLQTSASDVMRKPTHPTALGQYFLPENTIGMNLEKISGSDDRNFENIFFTILCHEETHSVSTNPHQQSGLLRLFNSLANRPTDQTGFQYGTLRENAFSMFNEGVTDTVAEEVYDEYIKRSGDRTLFINTDSTSEFRRNYPNERNILKAFMSAISRMTDVPEEVVWSGIKQSYFSNADLAGSELAKLYEEVLRANIATIIKNPTVTRNNSRNTIRSLGYIQPDEEKVFVTTLVESMKAMTWTDTLKKRASDALTKLISPERK
jgi:hypothetical protein